MLFEFYNLFEKAKIKYDTRFKYWAKYIDSIDTSKPNGYCFEGDFLRKGTNEISSDSPQLVLLAAEVGSRGNHSYHYQVIRIETDDTISVPSELYDKGDESGWALRLRDKVKAELDKINTVEPISPLAHISDDDLLTEIKRRNLVIE